MLLIEFRIERFKIKKKEIGKWGIILFMISFKLVKYIFRIKKKKSGLRKFVRKVLIDCLFKFEWVFKV